MASDTGTKRRVFAKLFDYKDSQILVKLSLGNISDASPSIRFFYWPSEDVDVCSTSLNYSSANDRLRTIKLAMQAFEEIDEAKAIEAIRPILKMFGELEGELEDHSTR